MAHMDLVEPNQRVSLRVYLDVVVLRVPTLPFDSFIDLVEFLTELEGWDCYPTPRAV